jgi:type IV secretory pathway VirB10-like protein
MMDEPHDPGEAPEHGEAATPATPAPGAPRSQPQEMRLHAARPPVTRLSRKVLVGLGLVASAAILAALGFALWPHRSALPTQVVNTGGHNSPEGLSSLPHDYAGLAQPAPKLGPPLPGDLGKPMLNAGTSAPGMPVPALTPEQQRVAQERDAARTSHLFAATNVSQAIAPAVTLVQPANAINPSAPSGTTDADHKLAFLGGPPDHQTQSPDRLQSTPSPFVLQAGAVIPAALITGLRSDLPGQITAQITENVYDSPTGKILLIPQGARLIGQYDAQITFGQSRALLVWNRLLLPNGRSIVLERQPGTDAEGYAGLEDEVDNHWGQLFEAAILSTVLSVGAEAGTSNSENNLAQAIRQGASQNINQTGEQVVGRSLNIQPTITVRQGFPVRVMVTHDLVLEPYGN